MLSEPQALAGMLASAGLLHDTALQKLGFDINSNLANLPKEKHADFKRHPEMAVELVAGKKFIKPRVLRLIQDHEEYGDGLGFPKKNDSPS
jgi:response regulator RpfG family c-di-GMP phosphodiesterase